MSIETDMAGSTNPKRPYSDALTNAALCLARSFVTGGRLWCVSERWPTYARQLADEFVSPVVLGKPSLPARHFTGSDVVGALRLVARPGDVVLLIGAGDEALSRELLLRSDAWGLSRIWLAAGQAPPPGLAEHVVRQAADDLDVAARSDDLELLCHLLWEVTHEMLGHQDLLAPEPECEGPVCVTCSDQATTAEVQALEPDGLGQVITRGRTEVVDLSLVDGVRPGSLVLVHAGVAISVLEES